MLLSPFFRVCFLDAFSLLLLRHFKFASKKSKLYTKIMNKNMNIIHKIGM